ncbi:MAG: IS110 family transposase [Pseudomonadota bacterium]
MEFIGIDIAKRKFDVSWLSGEKVRKSKVFENTAAGHGELLAWLKKHGMEVETTHLGMEATSQYYEALAHSLFDAGYTVSVINPLQIKAFGESKLRRQKTDKADAELIARFCAQNKPTSWQAPPKEVRELQRLLARVEALQDMLVQEQNRRYEAQGIALESVERILTNLNEEKRRLEKMIEDHIDRHPGLRARDELLQSIPGVGPTVSSYVLAWLRPERFDDARQAVAFVGLSPSHHESGDSVRVKSRLSKLGHGRLRKILYFPAMSAMRCNLAAQALTERLRLTGKPGKLIVAAIMRKMIHWMMGVLKSGTPFNASLALAKG